MPTIDHHSIIRRLETAPNAFVALAYKVTPREAHYKPTSGAWSIHEILCHVVDEERLDFRPRLMSVLANSGVWPDWKPDGPARVRSYQSRDFHGSFATFAKERRQSIAWLRSLRAPNWTRAYQHPRLGPIRAGDLLCAWPAHDALHFRQVAKRLYEIAGRDGEAMSPKAPFITRYAGDWGP